VSVASKVTVVDHGAGNLRSVVRVLTHVGADVCVTADPAQVRDSDRIVLPGQGAFGDCMQRLRASGLDDAVREHVAAGRPYLGICLGLQVLFETGLEHGEHAGLGLFKGTCERLPRVPGLKLPHMGWNQIHGDALGPEADGAWFYFVHSYRVLPSEPLASVTTDYGVDFVSGVARDNVTACQFHPEKSQAAGCALLERFIR